MLRSLPFDSSSADFLRILVKNDTVIIQFCTDRASANFAVVRYIFYILKKLPITVLGHHELCWPHGVALAKGRSATMKVVPAVLSLGKILRVGRDYRTAFEIAAEISKSNVVVSRRQRPPQSQ